jgi:hypothetical protein
MRLYKGVAPGSHHAGDAQAGQPFASATRHPRLHGFHGDPNLLRSPDAVVRHIINYSWPSPYVSVSMSFAVAADYATRGGWVFEIDFNQLPAGQLIDPLEELVKGFPRLHEHDGHQDLVHAVAAPTRYGAILNKPPLAPGPNGTAAPKSFHPRVSDELQALVFAARDAELLLPSIPSSAVLQQILLVP